MSKERRRGSPRRSPSIRSMSFSVNKRDKHRVRELGSLQTKKRRQAQPAGQEGGLRLEIAGTGSRRAPSAPARSEAELAEY